MEKKEFVTMVEKKLDSFMDFIENLVSESYKEAKTPIQKKRFYDAIEQTKMKSIRELLEIFRAVVEKGNEMGIKREDPEIETLIEKFRTVEGRIRNLDPEKIKSEKEMRQREPIDNLGTIEEPKVISITKEEIGDKLIDLNEQKNNAISETEKKDIENKIKYYQRLYQESRLKRRKI